MNTLTYAELEDSVFRELGLDPALSSAKDRADCAAFATSELARAWKWGKEWSLWCPVFEATGVPQWNAVTAYPAGTKVWFAPDSLYYLTAAGAAAGQTPPDNPSVWAVTAAPAFPDMDTVFGVFLRDPRQEKNAPTTDFVLTPAGVLCPAVRPDQTVWIHYRSKSPVFTSTEWVDQAWPINSRVRHAGECWVSAGAEVGDEPGLSDSWAVQPVPLDLKAFLEPAVASRLFRSKGQRDQAAPLAADAETELIRAYDRIGAYARVV